MIPNTKIREMVVTKSIHHHIQQQRIKWFGHLRRLPIQHPAQSVYSTTFSGRKARGRPRKTLSLYKIPPAQAFRREVSVSVSISAHDVYRSAQKCPHALRPVSQQSPQGCPRNSANICLVEHRSFSTLEGGMSAASFLHSSFLQAINAVMLWLVRVEKVPQASEHLCPAELQTRCDICSATDKSLFLRATSQAV